MGTHRCHQYQNTLQSSMSPPLNVEFNEDTQETVHQLWDELAALPMSRPEHALSLLFSCLGQVVDSRHGFWLSSLRMDATASQDALLGWRVRSIYFHGEFPKDQAVYQSTVKRLDKGQCDESTYNHVKQAGRFRAVLLKDHVSSQFYRSHHYIHHYLGRGIKDRLFVVLPANRDVESYFVFDRLTGEPDFGETDLAIASYAIRSLAWFNRQMLLGYGHLLATSPLTPRERSVIRLLLAGKVEKGIAAELSLSPNTAHQYVTKLLRKFSVNSRAELTALWLGH